MKPIYPICLSKERMTPSQSLTDRILLTYKSFRILSSLSCGELRICPTNFSLIRSAKRRLEMQLLTSGSTNPANSMTSGLAFANLVHVENLKSCEQIRQGDEIECTSGSKLRL